MEQTNNSGLDSRVAKRKSPHNVKRDLRVRLAEMWNFNKYGPLVYAITHVEEDRAIGLMVSERNVEQLTRLFGDYGIDVLKKRHVHMTATKGNVQPGYDYVVLSVQLVDNSDIGFEQKVEWVPTQPSSSQN